MSKQRETLPARKYQTKPVLLVNPRRFRLKKNFEAHFRLIHDIYNSYFLSVKQAKPKPCADYVITYYSTRNWGNVERSTRSYKRNHWKHSYDTIEENPKISNNVPYHSKGIFERACQPQKGTVTMKFSFEDFCKNLKFSIILPFYSKSIL